MFGVRRILAAAVFAGDVRRCRGAGHSAERSARPGTRAIHRAAGAAGAAGRRIGLAAEHHRAAGGARTSRSSSPASVSPARPSTAKPTSRRSMTTCSASAFRCRRSTISRSASPRNTAPPAMCCRAPSCRRRSSPRAARWCASRWSRAMSTRWYGRRSSTRYRDFFTDYARKITADRPTNIRTLERYLLLANDLPGLKFTTTLKASPTSPGASTLIVEVIEKPIDALGAHRQPRHRRRAARASFSAPPRSTTLLRPARGVHRRPMRARSSSRNCNTSRPATGRCSTARG